MKRIHFPLSLTLCVLITSCATELADHRMVSDAWLDTSPRRPQLPARPSDGITHWNAGLPSARAVSMARKSSAKAGRPVSHPTPVPRSDYAGQESYDLSPGYITGYRSHYRSRGGHPRHGRYQSQRQVYERTVEKVGPSIVPRMDVPLIDRSAGASSSTQYTYPARDYAGGSRQPGNKPHTASTRGGRGRR
ncbi:MAG: hypothetical protein H7A51_17640 [Akkermansiaceae bacterium]|nr:hypothetical protein [Akkermansiaceae bacterium]